MRSSFYIVLIATLILGGCSGAPKRGDGQCATFEDKLQATDLTALVSGMTTELNASLPVFDPSDPDEYGILLVADFVNVNTLRSEPNALVMSDMMRSYLARIAGKKVLQVEFGKDIRLSESGLVSLTRKIGQAGSPQVGASQVIVGTYLNLNNKLIINVKAIDPSTQIISSAIVRELNYTCSGGKLVLNK
uniref:FlgO family outer membrane protein n=1 Tax=Polynucleobacter sp. TaxID=2029855 RepID=UPI0040481A2B